MLDISAQIEQEKKKKIKQIEEQKQKEIEYVERVATFKALGAKVNRSTDVIELLATLNDKAVKPHLKGMNFGDLLDHLRIRPSGGSTGSKSNGKPRLPRTSLTNDQILALQKAFPEWLKQVKQAEQKDIEGWLARQKPLVDGKSVNYSYFQRKILNELEKKKLITKNAVKGPKGFTRWVSKGQQS